MEELKTTQETSNPQIRQLAAIMFTDMTGYTAMMQEDEKRAKVLRDKQRRALEEFIPAYNGKILQYYGDGSLSIFNSAIDAVKAAIEIQKDLQREPKVNHRIGIHSGDLCYDEQGIYGDCVNVASRIESSSIPGAVLISDKVYDEIKNQTEITSIPMGKFSFKNVKQQIGIHAITNEGLAVPTPAQLNVKAGSEKSIAVLPFVNMSSDPENEYFSDGISEEILNALTKVEGLQVSARTSSFSFKGKNEDVRQIGVKLGVSTVLEGSVRRSGKRIRITAQLINTSDGYHLWSEVYDSDLEDIFQVQDEISLKIVTRLKENFAGPAKETHIVKPLTENIDAYNLYLKGRYYWNKSNPEDIQKALNAFEEAIRLDPGFASTYCMLSFCYSWMGSTGVLNPSEAYSKAKDYTLKAIELDPNHAESHLALATIKFYNNWDFQGAEVSLNKAIHLGLNSSLLHQVHGWFLIARGEFTKAIEKMEQAVILDPLSLPLMAQLGDAYSFAGRFEDALKEYDKVIDLDPKYRRAYEAKGMTYLAMGDYDKAIENLEIYQKLIGHPLKGFSSLGHAYAAGGYPEKAQECLEKIRQRQASEPNTVLDMDFAFIYSGMKEYDKAFHFLNRVYEQRTGIACLGMIFCIRYPMLNELKSDPRFNQLTSRIGLD
jgi:TolB-like protein/Tfp pilus assembly protein PilF